MSFPWPALIPPRRCLLAAVVQVIKAKAKGGLGHLFAPVAAKLSQGRKERNKQCHQGPASADQPRTYHGTTGGLLRQLYHGVMGPESGRRGWLDDFVAAKSRGMTLRRRRETPHTCTVSSFSGQKSRRPGTAVPKRRCLQIERPCRCPLPIRRMRETRRGLSGLSGLVFGQEDVHGCCGLWLGSGLKIEHPQQAPVSGIAPPHLRVSTPSLSISAGGVC